MKEQLIEKVRTFREAFGLKQDDPMLHFNLMQEEVAELEEAANNNDHVGMVDAYADLVFVLSGGIIDGFEEFQSQLDIVIDATSEIGIDLHHAVDAVFTSNMSKLCSKDQIAPTADKYAFIGVPVRFEAVDELDESAGFRCVCAETVTGDDGKEYPAGKLLKSVGYQEPDWSYLDA